jgi:hypothetical protein
MDEGPSRWRLRFQMRYRFNVSRRISILGLAALSFAAAAHAQVARPETLFARGHWAALKFGSQCVAEARPLLPAAKRQPEARAGFSFIAGRGEFHARLSQMPRPGSSVMLTISDRPFMLVVRGDWAWSSGPLQDSAIIAAARGAQSMRIEARDGSGRRFVDHYPLDGAPTAIDAAAAGCLKAN